MPFQCATLGPSVEVGNYTSFFQASPSRASSQAHQSQASYQAIQFGASFLLQACFRTHPFQGQYLYLENNEDNVCDEDDVCGGPPLFGGRNEDICRAPPDGTRLVLISLYHPCIHYKLGCVKNLFIKFIS